MTTETTPQSPTPAAAPELRAVVDDLVQALVLVLILDETDPFSQARRPRTGLRNPTYRDVADGQMAAARALAAKDRFYSVDLDPEARAQIAGAVFDGVRALDSLRGPRLTVDAQTLARLFGAARTAEVSLRYVVEFVNRLHAAGMIEPDGREGERDIEVARVRLGTLAADELDRSLGEARNSVG